MLSDRLVPCRLLCSQAHASLLQARLVFEVMEVVIARLRIDLIASLKHTKRSYPDDKAKLAARMFADGELFRSGLRFPTGIETVRLGDVLCTCRASSISLTFPRSHRTRLGLWVPPSTGAPMNGRPGFPGAGGRLPSCTAWAGLCLKFIHSSSTSFVGTDMGSSGSSRFNALPHDFFDW